MSDLDTSFGAVFNSGFNDSALGWVNYATDIGTLNNYALTLPSPPSAYVAGMTIAFNPASTNTAASTINVNSLGAKSITTSSGLALSGNEIVKGVPALIIYNGTSFFIEGTSAVPVGAVQLYAGTVIPVPWMVCNGAAISRTTFASLFAITGSAYGPGDGSTTFNLPNLVGYFPTQGAPGASGGASSVTLGIGNMPAHNHVINIGDPGHTHVINVTESAHQHTYQFPASVGATLGGTTLFAGGATPALTSATAAGVTASANAAGTGIYANSNNTGSGAAFSIVPQYLSFNFIIKVF